MQIALQLLEGERPTIWIGRLKTVLQNSDAYEYWAMEPVLRSFASEVSFEDCRLLSTLVSVMSGSMNVSELDHFAEWSNSKESPT